MRPSHSNPVMQAAKQHHQAGQLAEAEALYRQILAAQPQQPDALHLLGLIAQQVGQHEAAVSLISQAIALNQADAIYHACLGDSYRYLGRLDEAFACYERALARSPDYPEAHNNLGIVLSSQSRWEEAIVSFRRALATNPDYAEAHNNLGALLIRHGDPEEAIVSFRRALAINPDYAEARNNLGTLLKRRGDPEEALACFQKALAINPDYAEAHNNVGNILFSRNQWVEAGDRFSRALAINPGFAAAQINLGNALKAQGRIDDAILCYQRAAALQPDFAAAYSNLGTAWKEQGQLDKEIECYRHAMTLDPEHPSYHSNVIYALHFHPEFDAAALYAEHQQWDRQHGKPRRQFQLPHPNDPDPQRRLKIGYVSPDLREHPLGRFLRPLLEQHDHERYEITCYADLAHPDALTEKLRAHSDHWRRTESLTEEQLAEQIRQDGIDILVDLTLHSAANRLPVFARKPAPVQMTTLAYAGTSGLTAMDYRLTDPFLDPPDQTDDYYSETSLRLPHAFWCYQAPEEAPAVVPLPALPAGHITFGCLNNFSKVNDHVLLTWARILQVLPNSRLRLHAHEGSHRQQAWNLLAEEGICPERVSFVGLLPLPEYYAQHGQMDIALDTFPYAGGTTTCDALWMGVPVVSLVGKTAVGRGGLSLLSNIGLPELAAKTQDEYLMIAVELANDLPRLAELRVTMQERMLASPLMDAPRFARAMENAYRTMWEKWCEGQDRLLSTS